MKYFKDPLSKETPYDKLKVGPDTPVNNIHEKIKEFQKKYYAEKAYNKLKELREAQELLISTSERLKIDFFYYCLPDDNTGGKDTND